MSPDTMKLRCFFQEMLICLFRIVNIKFTALKYATDFPHAAHDQSHRRHCRISPGQFLYLTKYNLSIYLQLTYTNSCCKIRKHKARASLRNLNSKTPFRCYRAMVAKTSGLYRPIKKPYLRWKAKASFVSARKVPLSFLISEAAKYERCFSPCRARQE